MRSSHSALCEGDWIVCTIDHASATTGLLIVSGGNEIAAGPRRSMARLAAIIADRGWPVVRFDRRGIGDSGGANGGFRSSGPDIVAACGAASHWGVKRLVAFGNCDAATSLALATPLADSSNRASIVTRVLANPWLGPRQPNGIPSAAATGRHYRRRIADPSAWRALIAGRIDRTKLAAGVLSLAGPTGDEPLAAEAAAALIAARTPVEVIISTDDAIGATFAAAWQTACFTPLRQRVPLHRIATASHGFTGEDDLGKLATILTDALERADRQAAQP